jgi:hypothetical protein
MSYSEAAALTSKLRSGKGYAEARKFLKLRNVDNATVKFLFLAWAKSVYGLQ